MDKDKIISEKESNEEQEDNGESLAEEETELENLVENAEQSMSTTFTPATSRTFKPISPTLKAEPIQDPFQEPIQTLETELEDVPGTTSQDTEEEESGYEAKKLYSETPTEESAQQLSDYQAQAPGESIAYDTQQTMNATQRFDTSSGLSSGMQNEKRQFQQWQQNQGDPFRKGQAGPSETYTVNPQKIDDTKNLPFKKNKKKGPLGF